MATAIRMLRLSKGQEAGRVVAWLKSVGDSVKQGEALVEVETEKSTVEVEAPHGGTLLEVIVPEDEEVPVGTILGWLGQPGEKLEEGEAPQPWDYSAADTEDAAADEQIPADRGPVAEAGRGTVRASPALRRLAAQRGIDLASLVGSGPGGRITKADVEAAVQARQPTADRSAEDAQVERLPLQGIRKIMAERMALSAHTAAAVTTVVDVDLAAIRELKQTQAVTYTSAVVKAAGLALRERRILNASLDGEQIVLHKNVNVGVAVDSPRGLVIVTIAGADERPLLELDKQLRELSGQAKQGALKVETMEPSTFTVTNSGVLGSLLFTPIINPPQSAILGMGKVQDMPVVRDGRIVIRPVMYLCLTYDHRIVEGAEAVGFLQLVKNHLEDPEQLG